MEIKGKAHCLFEQSGTFKREFIKLGIPAEDYDIQNNFGETDHINDLFAEIEKAYEGGVSLFDNMKKEDIIMAFFPCIYFCAFSQIAIDMRYRNYQKLTIKETTDAILERSHNREYFFSLAVKMLSIAMQRGLRLIMENPWNEQTFLKSNFILPPSLVDIDRTRRGDYFKKPTAYWFINCEPTHGFTEEKNTQPKRIEDMKKGARAGLCSEDRSMISPDYARNFICDFLLAKPQVNTLLQLF